MAAGESKETKELKRIYEKYGDVNNEEFYQCVHKFLYFLQHRYIGERVPEIDGDFWGRLVQSMEYYDPEKTNIVTWVHTIGRNVCSSYNYQKEKRSKEEHEGLETIQHEEAHEPLDFLLLDPDILGKVFTLGNLKSKSRDLVKLGKKLINLPDENPIKRHLQWTTLKLNLM